MNPASESATSHGDVVEQPGHTVEPPGDITQPVDKSANRVRQMFSEIAPQYDRMNHLLSMNVDRL
ncbi:MAG: bifunctional demethylmenaquinone methyltransferase/2-methoxy-6-polyprenyl-1,4-benzoquinol methylase UbiE, partial [Pirellulaceae bacterium]